MAQTFEVGGGDSEVSDTNCPDFCAFGTFSGHFDDHGNDGMHFLSIGNFVVVVHSTLVKICHRYNPAGVGYTSTGYAGEPRSERVAESVTRSRV